MKLPLRGKDAMTVKMLNSVWMTARVRQKKNAIQNTTV